MITDIHNSNSKTELVQLRIAVNMIMNLTYLDSDKRLEWSNWIKELYWKRKAVINQYIGLHPSFLILGLRLLG